MKQMTLFELEPVKEVDLNTTSEEEMVRLIELATGLHFKYKNELWGWIAGDKKMRFDVKYSNYAIGDRRRFISCGYEYHTKGNIGGCHGPHDSVDEAVEFFRKGIERWCK